MGQRPIQEKLSRRGIGGLNNEDSSGGAVMAAIIFWQFPDTTTTVLTPTKRYCMIKGVMCELATVFGYCQISVCVMRRAEQ